jgi:hypothetical protein
MIDRLDEYLWKTSLCQEKYGTTYFFKMHHMVGTVPERIVPKAFSEHFSSSDSVF